MLSAEGGRGSQGRRGRRWNTPDNPVCSWRGGPILASPARKLLNHPTRILHPYLSPGMTAADVGCGMGFFTIPMSGMVGEQGKVIAFDLQPEMLEGLRKNMQQAGATNIAPHLCSPTSLQAETWNGGIDFALVFWMLHEVPNAEHLIKEIQALLAPGGTLLFAEPIMHVSKEKFQQSVKMIEHTGFTVTDRPDIAISRAAAFKKQG